MPTEPLPSGAKPNDAAISFTNALVPPNGARSTGSSPGCISAAAPSSWNRNPFGERFVSRGCS